MREVTQQEFKKFLKKNGKVVIGETTIKLGNTRITAFQPDHFELERTNTWSFPDRGTWATHKGDFRGNWPPQLARNVILRYSKPGETVLDQLCGSGTTLIECKLLGRNCIGIDINEDAIMIARDRIGFEYKPLDSDFPFTTLWNYVGDARKLD